MVKLKKGKKLKCIDPDENPFEFIYHPYVTEKTMNLMERLNRLEMPEMSTIIRHRVSFPVLWERQISWPVSYKKRNPLLS